MTMVTCPYRDAGCPFCVSSMLFVGREGPEQSLLRKLKAWIEFRKNYDFLKTACVTGKLYGTQVTQWDFQNKATCTSPARLSFVLKVPLCNLRPSKLHRRRKSLWHYSSVVQNISFNNIRQLEFFLHRAKGVIYNTILRSRVRSTWARRFQSSQWQKSDFRSWKPRMTPWRYYWTRRAEK